MYENLKILPESKQGLDWLKKTYNFTTYSIAIDTVVNFFKINKVNPKDISFGDIETTTLNNKDQIIKKTNDDTERIISIIRNIEVNLIAPINKKLISISDIAAEQIKRDLNESVIAQNAISSSNERDLKNTLIEKENLIRTLEIELKQSKSKIDEYHEALKTLNMSMRVDTSKVPHVPYIKLSVEEAEKLFILIPNNY